MKKRKTTSSNYLNQSFLEKRRALNELIYFLGKRWVTEVFISIEEGNNRFSSIKDDLKGISDHILASRLRMLETNQLVIKRIFHEYPPHVEYILTKRGMELNSLLAGLCNFAETTSLAHIGGTLMKDSTEHA